MGVEGEVLALLPDASAEQSHRRAVAEGSGQLSGAAVDDPELALASLTHWSGFDDMPDDAALLELGRLTWAAILLEDVMQAVCRYVTPQRDNDSTGEQVRRARAAFPRPRRSTAARAHRRVA